MSLKVISKTLLYQIEFICNFLLIIQKDYTCSKFYKKMYI